MARHLPCEGSLQIHTPIGSKLVFEKWSDGTNDYVAINLVFAKVGQLQNRTLLSLDEPPMVLPVTVAGLTTNAGGLYRLEDIDSRMLETMGEYDAIEDTPTAIPAASAHAVTPDEAGTYTLAGTAAVDSTLGVVIKNNRKVFRK